jgi:Icc-related predicted phosphoesterase
MAENGQANYIDTLQQALLAKKDVLERTDLIKLKDELRIFQISFASLYNIYLKKKIIDEDPYKQDTKISELSVPDSGVFQDAKRIEQLTIRLSNFDNQLDYLVNFYQLHIDYLNLERIKRIVGLVRYIDWVSFSPDSQSIMTKSVAEMTNQSKAGVDSLTLSIIGESLSKLSKTTTAAMNILKDLNTYYRESYKLNVRLNVTKSMSAGEAHLENIKKKVHSEMPGTPFYKELIDEIIKEDYTDSGADLKETILNSLRVAETKQKAAKAAVNFKNILLDGIIVIGGASNSLTEISGKLADNQAVMDSRKKTFFEAIKELIRQITNAEPEEVIYTVDCMDVTKGVPVKEKVNFHQFMDEIEKKTRILASFVRGTAYNKLAAMTEEQIISYLEKNVKDIQGYHRILTAMDDFFKTNVQTEDRGKIKGIKPELSALKNTYIKANQLRYEYSAQKEAEEQMKRLGANMAAASASAAAAPAPAPAASS